MRADKRHPVPAGRARRYHAPVTARHRGHGQRGTPAGRQHAGETPGGLAGPDVSHRVPGPLGAPAGPDGNDPGAGRRQPGEPGRRPVADGRVRPPPADAVVLAPPHAQGLGEDAHLPFAVVPDHRAGDLPRDHQDAAARGHPAQAGHPSLSGRKVELARGPALPGEAVGGRPEHRRAHEIVAHRAHVLAHGGEPAGCLRQRLHAVAAGQRRDTRPEPPGAAVRRRPRRARSHRQPSSVTTGNHQRHPPAGRGAQDGRLPGAAAIGRREDQRAGEGKRGLRAHRNHRAAGRGHPGERGRHFRRGCSARPGELCIGQPGGRGGHHQPGRAAAGAQPAGDDDASDRHGEQRHAGNGTDQERAAAAPGMRAAGPARLPAGRGARMLPRARGAARPAWRARQMAGRPGPHPAAPSRARPGSARCAARRRPPGSHLASRCHSSPASRHALIDCCHTDRPPAPAGARDVAGPRARAPRIRCQLPARGSVPVPEPPRVPGPPSATGIVVGADAGPGSGWSPPAVRLSQPGPAASIPPGCPRRAGVRPRAGMTPRSVHGETVRLAPPVEPAFLLTDRPMRWSCMNKACASRQGTRFVSRPTMVAAPGLQLPG